MRRHAFLLPLLLAGSAAGDLRPENLALKARAVATSDYRGGFGAERVVDGKIPAPLSRALSATRNSHSRRHSDGRPSCRTGVRFTC